MNNRKQRVKINWSFSSFQNIISGVPQGSFLAPLLFNIFLTDIFIFCPTEIASYADDNTPYTTGDCLKKTLQKVEEAPNIVALARIANYMKITQQHYECIYPFIILVLPIDMDAS